VYGVHADTNHRHAHALVYLPRHGGAKPTLDSPWFQKRALRWLASTWTALDSDGDAVSRGRVWVDRYDPRLAGDNPGNGPGYYLARDPGSVRRWGVAPVVSRRKRIRGSERGLGSALHLSHDSSADEFRDRDSQSASVAIDTSAFCERGQLRADEQRRSGRTARAAASATCVRVLGMSGRHWQTPKRWAVVVSARGVIPVTNHRAFRARVKVTHGRGPPAHESRRLAA
jgi:hypothetical protein